MKILRFSHIKILSTFFAYIVLLVSIESHYADNSINSVRNNKIMSIINPIAYRDKLNGESGAWRCEYCEDTNLKQLAAKNEISKWQLTLHIDNVGELIRLRADNAQAVSNVDTSSNCQNPSNTNSTNSVEILYFSRITLPLGWFILGIITTLACLQWMNYASLYFKKYIDNYIEKLEEECLNKYKNGNFIDVIKILVKNIPYIINFRGAKHLDTAHFQHILAKSYLSLNSSTSCIISAERLLNDVRSIYDPLGKDFYLANVLEDLGTVFFIKEQFDNALDSYIAALDIHLELLSENSAADLTNILSSKNSPTESINSPEINKYYEDNYRRLLINKAFVEAKINTPRSSTSGSTDKQSSASQSKFSDDLFLIDDDVNFAYAARSLSDVFELESDNEGLIRGLESLLTTPECNKSSNSSSNIPNDVLNNSTFQIPANIDTIRLHHLIGKTLCKQGKEQSGLEYFTIALEMAMRSASYQDLVQELKCEIERLGKLFSEDNKSGCKVLNFDLVI